MKVYFAGVNSAQLRKVCRGANVLFSFASLRRARGARLPSGEFGSVMVDSGAFSAYRSDVQIDVEGYCRFLTQNLDRIDHYVNLDVIGDAEASAANLMIMQSHGLSPMPVFHFGEDLNVLRRMRDEHPLIGLGGMVPRSRPKMLRWLEKIFEWLPHRYHGFGIGDVRLIKTFPFQSVDNTTWKRVVQGPVLKTTTNTGVNWAENLTRAELFSIGRKFYERLLGSEPPPQTSAE